MSFLPSARRLGRPAVVSPAGSVLAELVPEPIDLTAVPLLSLRRPSRSPLARLAVHVLIRLLLIQTFPAHWQRRLRCFRCGSSGQ